MKATLSRLRTWWPGRARLNPGSSHEESPGLEGGRHYACTVRHALYGQFELVIDRGTSDSGALSYTQGEFFNNRLVWLLRRLKPPGGRVLDLGANIGTFALGAAATGFEVVAIEASAKHADLLRRSVRRNQFAGMTVVEAAVSDRSGTLRFHADEQWGTVAHPGIEAPTVEVPAVAVDDLVATLGWNAVDFIKMDVEGSEVAALRGMAGLLARDDAPIIAFESNALTLELFGETTGALMRLLTDFGYRVYRFDESGRFELAPPDPFQPEAVVDLVALKPSQEPLIASDIDPPSDRATIARVVREAAHESPSYRRHVARALAQASAPILADPQVGEALDRLLHDPDPSVRTAAQWWSQTRAA